jgi:hypothetical protein
MAALGRKPLPNRHLKGHMKMSVYPTNFQTRLLDRLQMLSNIQAIPLNPTSFGAYATPDLARLMPLSKLLIYIVFPASKA